MTITIKAEFVPYLEASARLRNMSSTILAKRLLHTILRDQLILATLDDGDEIANYPVPVTHVEKVRDEVRKQNVHRKTQYNPQMTFKRPAAMTREDLRRELEQAAANTASLPVE